MSAMDLVLNEVEGKFGISPSTASSLLASVLGYINEQSAGVRGLLDRFKQAGLGEPVSYWLGGVAKPLSSENVEKALGTGTITSMASKAGISAATTASALAFMIPKIVQGLAPGGVIPSRLPAEFASYLSGPTAAVATGARDAAYAVSRAGERTGVERYLWPIAAAVALVLLGFWFWNRNAVQRTAFNAEDAVRVASQRATDALTSLRPGFSAQDLAGALNLEIINFGSGSADIPQYSYDFLNKAATAIKVAPAGTALEIGGHTDNTGDATSNVSLSQARAESVRGYLVKEGVDPAMLTAQGYGDAKPVASNDTEEGRFRNRRIEFTTVR